jgi:peptidoglycan/LPS O-acetylase OafA/YrhL
VPWEPDVPPQRFSTLDGLRGVAALCVVLFHGRDWFGPAGVSRGYLAVDLFFVLSGLVIAASYEAQLESGALTAVRFVKVRLIRLYPLYLLGLCLGLATPVLSLILKGRIIHEYAPAWSALPPALFMLPSPFSASAVSQLFPLNGPAWSLFFEIFINFAYVLTRRLWSVGGIVVAMAVAATFLLLSPDQGDGGWNWGTIGYGFARVFYSFPAGVLIYRLYAGGWRAPALSGWAIVALFPLSLLLPDGWGVRLTVLAVFPLIVALGTGATCNGWSRWLFAHAGALSYALYAIHIPAMELTREAIVKLRLSPPPLEVGAAFLILIVPACVLIDRSYDAPVRRSLSAWLGVRLSRAGSAARSGEAEAVEA